MAARMVAVYGGGGARVREGDRVGGGADEKGPKRFSHTRVLSGQATTWRAHATLAAKTRSKPPHVSVKPAKTILGVSPTKIIEFRCPV